MLQTKEKVKEQSGHGGFSEEGRSRQGVALAQAALAIGLFPSKCPMRSRFRDLQLAVDYYQSIHVE